jgi:hypothetical protein
MFRRYLPFLLFVVIISADELTCSTLRTLNTALVDFADGDCTCTDGSDTTSDSCTACFSGNSFKGIAESTSVKNLTGSTFSQQTEVELCFQYEEDMYGGAKVCYSYLLFGSNQDSQCTVTVDGTRCAACQTFTQVNLAFDCTNLSYKNTTGGNSLFEVRQDASVADSSANTLLRFMANTAAAEGCQTGGGSGGSGGSGSGPKGVAFLYSSLSTAFAIFGLLAY